RRVDHADRDWRASPQLVEALNLPKSRQGAPDAVQRDTALALAANAHGGATFAAIADADVRAACLGAFARLAELGTTLPRNEPLLYDLRCAGSVIRAGVVIVLADSRSATLAVVDDRNAAQRFLCAWRGGSQATMPAFDAVTVRAASGWFALAMRDALGCAFDVEMTRRRSGSTGPMLAAGAVLLGAIAKGLPDRPLAQPNGTGALATHALQSVCMLTRLPPARPAAQPAIGQRVVSWE
ncbi:hypothetical protein, partial [Citreimonas sp.]|uniref:hypothetical protein n=1 Tax=Citreimonas sp. TaxID=3036715 RepID=UPI004059BFB4